MTTDSNSTARLTAIGYGALVGPSRSSPAAGGGLVIDDDGRVLVAGWGSASPQDFSLTRLNSGGYGSEWVVSADFSSSMDYAYGVAMRADGTVMVVGATGSDFGALRVKQPSGLEERIYPLFDANYNVTTLVDATSQTLERFEEDPQGKFTVLNGDYSVDADGSDFGWVNVYQGGRFDAVVNGIEFRHRWLSVELQRWMSQDPIGYPDGLNRYEPLGSNPISTLDPMGLDRDAASTMATDRQREQMLEKRRQAETRRSAPKEQRRPGSFGDFLNGLGVLARAPAGLVGSALTGDIFEKQPLPSYGQGQCEFLVTITGIFTDATLAKRRKDQIAVLPQYAHIENVEFVRNGTHWKGAGDIAQVALHELLFAIDLPAMRAAKLINHIGKTARSGPCGDCYTIYVVAHSQGSMVFSRSLSLVDDDIQRHIKYVGVGPQTLISAAAHNLASARNIVGNDDPVPRMGNWSPARGGDRWTADSNIERIPGGHGIDGYIDYLRGSKNP